MHLKHAVYMAAALSVTPALAAAKDSGGKAVGGGGSSLLNQMLGGGTGKKTGAPAAPRTVGNKAATTKTAPAKAAAGPAGGAPAALPYRPSAVNKVDRRELIKSLTGQQARGSSPQAQMQHLLARMNTSATRLKRRKAGPVTQEVQRRIIMSLDTLIKMSEKNQSSSSSSQSQGSGQKRQKNNGNNQASGQGEGGNHAAHNHAMPVGGHSPAQSNGELDQQHREWGNLPPQARQMIANGIQEQPLPQYKHLIDQYYKKLAAVGRHHH